MFDYRFFRNSIAGVLTAFNNTSTVKQVIDGKPKDYNIPIYYEFGNDTQFMRDFFYELPTDCNIPTHSEGMHIKRPYGVMELKNLVIKKDEMGGRFSRANFDEVIFDEKTNTKKIVPLSAFVMNVPLDLTFELKIITDSLFQSLAITESIIKTFYKNTISYFTYKNLRVPLNIIIGESASTKHKVPLTYKDNEEREVPFTINVETYLPVFDDKEEGSLRFRGDNIRDFYERIIDESGEILNIKKLFDNGKYVGRTDTNNKIFKIIDIAGDIQNKLLSLSQKNSNKCLVVSNSLTREYDIESIYFDEQTCVKFVDNIPVDAEMIIFKVV